jgi:hypothetical protein
MPYYHTPKEQPSFNNSNILNRLNNTVLDEVNTDIQQSPNRQSVNRNRNSIREAQRSSIRARSGPRDSARGVGGRELRDSVDSRVAVRDSVRGNSLGHSKFFSGEKSG